MTNPNPGTNSLPFGVDKGCDELGVVCVFPAVGAGTAVSVRVWEVSVFATGAVETLALGTLSIATVVSNGAGAVVSTGAIGLIGLVGFVGFVKDFTQLFLVSAQAPKIG